MPARSKQDFTNAIRVTVTAIHGEYVQVRVPDGSTEDWSAAGLPSGLKVGDSLEVRAATGTFEIRVMG